MSGEPIDFREIEAWSGLRRIDLEDWEITALRRMDVARRKAIAEPEKMTPGKFRAMFGKG